MARLNSKFTSLLICGMFAAGYCTPATAQSLGGMIDGTLGGIGIGDSGSTSASSDISASANISGGGGATGGTNGLFGIQPVNVDIFGNTDGQNGLTGSGTLADGGITANLGNAASLNVLSGAGTGDNGASGQLNADLGLFGLGNANLNSGAGTSSGLNVGLGLTLDLGAPGTPGSGAAAKAGGTNAAGANVAVVNAVSSLSASQIAAFKIKCSQILRNPESFDRDLVAMCGVLRKSGS